MLRCAIVEDSPRELEHLKECLARYSAERDIPLETTAFGDAASFLEHYRADYDIVFMDIELPGINGMEAAHRLREIDQQVILIFVTNMAQFAVKGYEVDALDYIIKPAQYGPLSIKLDRAAQRWRAAAESVMVALPTGTQRLLLWEIYYIEVQGHKLTYHTEKASCRAPEPCRTPNSGCTARASCAATSAIWSTRSTSRPSPAATWCFPTGRSCRSAVCAKRNSWRSWPAAWAMNLCYEYGHRSV